MSSSLFAELGMTWEEAALTVLTAIGIYAAIIVFSRLFGQRQFSTSSSYDLALPSPWAPWWRMAKLSRAELHQQLRLAGVGALDQVDAVTLERNGRVSVISAGTPLDERVFDSVPDRAELFDGPPSR